MTDRFSQGGIIPAPARPRRRAETTAPRQTPVPPPPAPLSELAWWKYALAPLAYVLTTIAGTVAYQSLAYTSWSGWALPAALGAILVGCGFTVWALYRTWLR